MKDLFELVSNGNAQEISDRICKNVSDIDMRHRVLRAMFIMPMMFDERTMNTSTMVKAHLMAAMPEELWSRWQWGYWYKVIPIAEYVLKLPRLRCPHIPDVTIGAGVTAEQHARPTRIVPAWQTPLRHTPPPPPPLPKITFEYDCEETGHFYQRQDYEKQIDHEGETRYMNADDIEGVAEDELCDAEEDVTYTGDRDDYETDEKTIAFRNVRYHAVNGDVFLIDDGDRQYACDIEGHIEDIIDGDHEDWLE